MKEITDITNITNIPLFITLVILFYGYVITNFFIFPYFSGKVKIGRYLYRKHRINKVKKTIKNDISFSKDSDINLPKNSQKELLRFFEILDLPNVSKRLYPSNRLYPFNYLYLKAVEFDSYADILYYLKTVVILFVKKYKKVSEENRADFIKLCLPKITKLNEKVYTLIESEKTLSYSLKGYVDVKEKIENEDLMENISEVRKLATEVEKLFYTWEKIIDKPYITKLDEQSNETSFDKKVNDELRKELNRLQYIETDNETKRSLIKMIRAYSQASKAILEDDERQRFSISMTNAFKTVNNLISNSEYEDVDLRVKGVSMVEEKLIRYTEEQNNLKSNLYLNILESSTKNYARTTL